MIKNKNWLVGAGGGLLFLTAVAFGYELFFSAETDKLDSISKAARVEVLDKKAGVSVEVIDEDNVRRVVGNILSLKLSEGDYNKPTEMLYALKFCGADGGELATVFVPSGNWIGISGSGKVYYVKEGRVDISLLERLVGLRDGKGSSDN